jgi:hypothetical protein
MEELSPSIIGWLRTYGPPSGPRTLFSVHCETCEARCVCGEKEMGSACGDPLSYSPEDFHPATTPHIAGPEALRLPPPLTQPAVSLPPAIVIAKSFVSEDGRVAVHGDRLTGRTFHPVTNGIASLIGDDFVIKSLWDRLGSLGERLAEAGFSTAISSSFSTYWDNSPLSGLVALRQSAEMAHVLSRHLAVVPTLAWRTGADLLRWVTWLELSRVSAIAVHLSVRESSDWDWLLNGVRGIGRLFSKPPRLVAVGPSTLDRIQRVATAWPGDLTIASGRPWHLAQHGYELQPDLGYRSIPRLAKSRKRLWDENRRMFDEVVNNLIANRQFEFADAI